MSLRPLRSGERFKCPVLGFFQSHQVLAHDPFDDLAIGSAWEDLPQLLEQVCSDLDCCGSAVAHEEHRSLALRAWLQPICGNRPQRGQPATLHHI
jgi:hypothetical protein